MRERIPPGQRPISELPVLHVGAVPAFDPAEWDLRVEGLVEAPLRLSYQEVRALPSVALRSDFHCVTSWSRLDNLWEGALVSVVIELARPRPEAAFVTVECDGGYSTSLLLAEITGEDVLLAWGLDGKELAPEHGYPLRLVAPKKYAYKSGKWVRRLRLTAQKELGYWEARGYSDGADPWKEERRAEK